MLIFCRLGAGSQQASARRNVTVDPLVGDRPPDQIKRAEFGKKPYLGIVQMIVYPPRQIPPIPACVILISKPRNHDRSPRYARVPFAPIPDVALQWIVVARAIQPVFIAEPVQRRRPIARAYGDTPKGFLYRIQQGLAQGLTCFYGKIGVVGKVLFFMEIPDLGIQEIAHVEMFGQSHAAQRLKAPHAARFAHGYSTPRVLSHARMPDTVASVCPGDIRRPAMTCDAGSSSGPIVTSSTTAGPPQACATLWVRSGRTT